jgi:23S rRNA pseudouridine1911/1915/1917 synthase
MNEKFRNNEISKKYWAIVKNKPKKDSGTIVSWLKKNPKNNKSTSYLEEGSDKKKINS